MKLIVGLGNPGREYAETRHNIGFMVIDELSSKWNIPLNQNKFNGVFGSGTINGEKVVLLKPLTYMNLSGESIRPLMEYYKIEIEDFIVIYDDLDLVPGKLRLRTKGSAGGHNGIKSTIAHLGTQEFNRIRVGVGRPEGHMTVVDHVLGKFGPEEKQDVLEAVVTSVEACDAWMGQSFLNVMNKFNGK